MDHTPSLCKCCKVMLERVDKLTKDVEELQLKISVQVTEKKQEHHPQTPPESPAQRSPISLSSERASEQLDTSSMSQLPNSSSSSTTQVQPVDVTQALTPATESGATSIPQIQPVDVTRVLTPATESGVTSEVHSQQTNGAAASEPSGTTCFCRQGPRGAMLHCEATKCKYVWLHQDCLFMSNKARKKIQKAEEPWHCQECRGEGKLVKLMRDKRKAQEKEKKQQAKLEEAMIKKAAGVDGRMKVDV